MEIGAAYACSTMGAQYASAVKRASKPSISRTLPNAAAAYDLGMTMLRPSGQARPCRYSITRAGAC